MLRRPGESLADLVQHPASSHELCEVVADPVPEQGWYGDANGEIGDICAWRAKQLGGFTLRLEWSNSVGACQ